MRNIMTVEENITTQNTTAWNVWLENESLFHLHNKLLTVVTLPVLEYVFQEPHFAESRKDALIVMTVQVLFLHASQWLNLQAGS